MGKILYLCNMNNVLTFGGYPVTMELIDGEVYVTCKSVTGSLTEGELFLTGKKGIKYFFGGAKISKIPKRKVKIDCLTDTKARFVEIYEAAKKFKSEYSQD